MEEMTSMGHQGGQAADRARDGVQRRAFLIGGVGLALPLLGASPVLAAPPGVPATSPLSFRVYRKGAPIGEHTLKFDTDGDALTVTTDVHIVVHIGPVPVYRFSQHIVERWQGSRFMSMDCTTGTATSHEKTTAKRVDGGIRVEPDSADPYTVPEIYPVTHWNRQVYQSGLLMNPKDGKSLKVNVAAKVDDTVKLDDGSTVRATRYAITGDSIMDEYYDPQGVWCGMHSRVQDGSYVDYKRL